MKFAAVLAAMIFAVYAHSISLDAQGRGQAQVKKTSTSVSTPKAKSSARAPKSTPPKTAKTNTRTAKPETRAAKTVTKTDARAVKTAAKAETRAVKAEAKTARNTTTSPVPESTAAAPVLTTTVISPETPTTHSVKNAKLEARLLPLLPAGITVQDASQGFKNWGQFVAAVHVSNNLGIPFADLKTRMTGIAPGAVPGSTVQTAPMSLGQAIQSFKGATATGETGILSPTRITNEVKKAEDAANSDLRRTREAS
jgi:hypothetical protein